MHAAVTEQAVGDLLAGLIAIPSINPALRREGEPPSGSARSGSPVSCGDWLVRAGGGGHASRRSSPAGPNVVARLGAGRGPRMIWEGHLDTVQVAGMTVAPFAPVIRDGRIYGRGAVDDKGCLAMFMLAMRRSRTKAARSTSPSSPRSTRRRRSGACCITSPGPAL